MKRIHIIISGDVQGVFFRHHTNKTAQKLGLKGFVKNLANGCVEVVAEGPEEKIKEFIAFCKKGPESSYVDKVEMNYEEPKNDFTTFSIRY